MNRKCRNQPNRPSSFTLVDLLRHVLNIHLHSLWKSWVDHWRLLVPPYCGWVVSCNWFFWLLIQPFCDAALHSFHSKTWFIYIINLNWPGVLFNLFSLIYITFRFPPHFYVFCTRSYIKDTMKASFYYLETLF